MHLLAAKPGGFSDDEGIIDLQQSPADIVILSSQDSSLSLLAQVAAHLPRDYPSLRLANIIHLNKAAAFDLYSTQVLEYAKLIVVSLLGGYSYWSYGLDQLQLLTQSKQIPLVIVSGDDQVDQQLFAMSRAEENDCMRIWQFLRQAGQKNSINLFYYLAQRFFGQKRTWQAPHRLDKAWIYQPSLLHTNTHAALQYWQKKWNANHATALVILYRSHIQSGNTQAFDDLLILMQEQQLNALPVAISSLKEVSSLKLINQLLVTENIDIILNTTSFAANSGSADDTDKTPLNFSRDETQNIFSKTIPVIQLIFAANNREDWQDNPLGLHSRDLAMNIALPEMDGRIISRAIAFKSSLKRDQRTQMEIIAYRLQKERARFCIELAKKWTALQHKPNKEKRIALILANYPTKDGRIGNGVGLDTPASTINILLAMQQAGFDVRDIPENGNALIQLLLNYVSNNPDHFSLKACQQSLSIPTYQDYFQQLPQENQDEVLERWGQVENDPKVRQQRIMLSGIRLGKTFVGIQPARGYNMDISATYHDPDLVPPHHYLAFYFWLRHIYQVDAIAHIGKHGNLEWLPGKSLALSNACWPDAILGAMPHLYPFIVNDPGEGTQAKRRTQAVILDHLMPAMTRAENYGDLLLLEQLVDEYYQAMGLDQRREQYLQEQIFKALQNTQLIHEIKGETQTEKLGELDAYLCELKESQIRDGLHTFGESPKGEQRIDSLIALSRLPTYLGVGLLHALSADFAWDFDPLQADQSPWEYSKPECLSVLSSSLWRNAADSRERLELFAKQLLNYQYPIDADDFPQTYVYLDKIKQQLAPSLDSCGDNEIQQFIAALEGQFVPAGPSGAPTRGRLDTLPTGRNFYSVDTRAIPSLAAWQLGKASAEQLILRHLQEQGEYPTSLGLSVWGTATMRTGGDDIAQAFALMGVEPIWDQYNGRVIDFKIIPAMQLNRPRVDVTLRISGFFRDAFPNVVRLFAAAVEALADYPDSGDLNTIQTRIYTDIKLLSQSGLDAETAKRQATWRIFGSKPNSYGAGLQGLIDERCWDDNSDLARAYINWGGYAYDQNSVGESAHAIFEHRLEQLQVVVQNQDNREHDLLDSDDYYQFQGGMSNAVRVLSGKDPQVYHGDHSNPAQPKIRTLQEELNRVIRSRVLNPKWIKGMQRHGYKGAFEMAATVDYLFAYDATTDLIQDYQYEQLSDTYLLDSDNAAFLQNNNPHAMQEMTERLIEAMQRGLWAEPNDYKEKLESILMQIEASLETAT